MFPFYSRLFLLLPSLTSLTLAATYPETLDRCNGSYSIVNQTIGSAGIITSDSSGDLNRSYLDGVTCSFLISSSIPTARIKLSFEYSITECGYDNVFIYEGENSSVNSSFVAQLTGRRTYESSPQVFRNDVPMISQDLFISSGNSLYVEFKSDKMVNPTGFRAEFSVVGTLLYTKSL
jgi:hypothetical protein